MVFFLKLVFDIVKLIQFCIIGQVSKVAHIPLDVHINFFTVKNSYSVSMIFAFIRRGFLLYILRHKGVWKKGLFFFFSDQICIYCNYISM